ncbi:low molecular weight protein-tyrosine-phosphatase [Persicitalea jodogahamensis]|uniref:protein-tyrosine-phosphatase n=1 Tax=Persicitalea jodogahamensis TaxID=402147 RepID=A0A8J3CZS8_9BACT|nr:low molecular weight protein-tyrosine-phosphatase [Persicitalea jodogahamensis]GHB53633.1 protein-tyrosine-phosphatase [Persicitalea jodogahamensis]
MINVLFVCLGNICRSPIAEGVFRDLVHKAGMSENIQCDSAGTASYHIGSLPDRRIRQIAQEKGITLSHKARKLAGDDFYDFDYIVAMDETNFQDIRNQSYRSSGFYFPEDKLFLLREFDPESESSGENPQLSVPDPYYEDIAVFEEVYQIVERCGTGLLKFLVEKNQLVEIK